MLEGICVLWTPEEVLHQIGGWHRSTGLKHSSAIPRGSIAGQEIILIKLLEEVLGDHSVLKISVKGRRITSGAKMVETCVAVRIGGNWG